MAALSALVFALSWWMGLYLASRDPRKPVLVLAAVGLCGFAAVVAIDAIRVAGPAAAEALGRAEIYLVAVPGVAWFAVLMELARPRDAEGGRVREIVLTAAVAAAAALGAAWAGTVDGPLRGGHWLMFAVISLSTLAAMVLAARRAGQPARVAGVVVLATLFFALGNAIIVIPLGLVPSWIALAATGFDILLLGLAVALWDAFDEGQALRAAMVRSFLGTAAVVVVFGGQLLIGLTVLGQYGRSTLTVLLFTVLAVAIGITVLADPLAGLLDRVAFAQTNNLHALLQVRWRSTAQQNMERGSNALKVGGSGAAAGMALGLRGLSARQMGQLGMRLGSGDFKALLTPRGKKAAAIIGGAGALIGAGMRPAPVSLQYQRPEGNAAWRRSKRRERNR